MADQYRVVRTSLTRSTDDGVVTYEPGDELEPTEAELSAFGDNLEPVDGDDSNDADGDGDGDGDNADAPFDPGEYTVDELDAALADGDYDADDLDALAAAERDGESRETALEAIDAQRE